MRSLFMFLLLLPALPALSDEGHQHELTQQQLGSVHFQTSCSAAAAKSFDRGVALLHSFGYEDAAGAFQEAAAADPTCAMAYWGLAMSYYHGLWESGDAKLGLAAVQDAKRIAAAIPHTTEREAAYIEAIGQIYEHADALEQEARATAYEAAMGKIHAAYPEDVEAAIFYALSVDVTAPKTDKTYSHQRQCGEILAPIFERLPNHPGVAHYLIHCYDNPVLAAQALPAARRYASIAPASAHAHHMPSHIFTRVGDWQDSITSNLKSAAIAQAQEASSKTGEARGQRLHAMDYLEYAYLQSGQVNNAQQVVTELRQLHAEATLNNTGSYAAAAIPARFALELSRWDDAAQLQVEAKADTVGQAITWMARGIGAARSGTMADAMKAEAQLATLRESLQQRKDVYWANQVEVQRREVAGCIAQAQSKSDEAVSLLRSAAVLEESMEKTPVTPGPMIPARELLADLLLRQKQPAEALKEYQAVLQTSPKRFNALYGAGRAAESAKQPEIAADYYSQLLEVSAQHNERSEVQMLAKSLQAKNAN